MLFGVVAFLTPHWQAYQRKLAEGEKMAWSDILLSSTDADVSKAGKVSSMPRAKDPCRDPVY